MCVVIYVKWQLSVSTVNGDYELLNLHDLNTSIKLIVPGTRAYLCFPHIYIIIYDGPRYTRYSYLYMTAGLGASAGPISFIHPSVLNMYILYVYGT